MVLISRKVDYAILALVHLMRQPKGCSARELASTYGLSRAFLANILKDLCHHGLVESQRGIHGGYRLSADPAQLTVDEIIRLMDGQFRLTDCTGSDPTKVCSIMEQCPVRGPLQVIHERMMAVLLSTKLEDLSREPRTTVSLELENAVHGDTPHLS